MHAHKNTTGASCIRKAGFHAHQKVIANIICKSVSILYTSSLTFQPLKSNIIGSSPKPTKFQNNGHPILWTEMIIQSFKC